MQCPCEILLEALSSLFSSGLVPLFFLLLQECAMDNLAELQSGAKRSKASSKSSTKSTNVTGDFTKTVQLLIHSWTQSKCFACSSRNVDAAPILNLEQTNTKVIFSWIICLSDGIKLTHGIDSSHAALGLDQFQSTQCG